MNGNKEIKETTLRLYRMGIITYDEAIRILHPKDLEQAEDE
jgi:hypothetical protein